MVDPELMTATSVSSPVTKRDPSGMRAVRGPPKLRRTGGYDGGSRGAGAPVGTGSAGRLMYPISTVRTARVAATSTRPMRGGQ
jgi:hypothetical protein